MNREMNRKNFDPYPGPTATRGRPAWPPPRPTAARATLASLVGLLLLGLLGGCATQEIKLRFVGARAGKTAIQPASGWPLTLSLTARESELRGIGQPSGYSGGLPYYPTTNQNAFLVFPEDPGGDGCPSWVDRRELDRVLFPDCKTEPPWPEDEMLIEFKAGLNVPPGECTGQPQIKTFNADTGKNDYLEQIGPCVGDGLGYGPNPRLPGLMVLSDAGPGVVTDEEFNRPSPRKARNLAGLFHSVAYELKNWQGRTSILVHMNVPARLFFPVMLVDSDLEEPCPPGGRRHTIVRVDGGPEVCRVGEPHPADHKVTVRAFVVSGNAPAELKDLDANGIVDILDAEATGLKLVSAQAVIQFSQSYFYIQDCVGGGVGSSYPFDFDGNAQAPGSLCPLPGSPTQIEPPPR